MCTVGRKPLPRRNSLRCPDELFLGDAPFLKRSCDWAHCYRLHCRWYSRSTPMWLLSWRKNAEKLQSAPLPNPRIHMWQEKTPSYVACTRAKTRYLEDLSPGFQWDLNCSGLAGCLFGCLDDSTRDSILGVPLWNKCGSMYRHQCVLWHGGRHGICPLASLTWDPEHLATGERKWWNTFLPMGVFTQVTSNIKGFTNNLERNLFPHPVWTEPHRGSAQNPHPLSLSLSRISRWTSTLSRSGKTRDSTTTGCWTTRTASHCRTPGEAQIQNIGQGQPDQKLGLFWPWGKNVKLNPWKRSKPFQESFAAWNWTISLGSGSKGPSRVGFCEGIWLWMRFSTIQITISVSYWRRLSTKMWAHTNCS